MSWIQTYTGKKFDPLNPKVDDIDIVDIAHALSLKCRFNGHCKEFYSVAQHSVLMSRFIGTNHKLWALLHDAAEAYLPDVSGPIKSHLTNFTEIENNLLRMIIEKYGLNWPMPDSVKFADRAMLLTEKRDLLPHNLNWDLSLNDPSPYTLLIDPWTSKQAEEAFLNLFNELIKLNKKYSDVEIINVVNKMVCGEKVKIDKFLLYDDGPKFYVGIIPLNDDNDIDVKISSYYIHKITEFLKKELQQWYP